MKKNIIVKLFVIMLSMFDRAYCQEVSGLNSKVQNDSIRLVLLDSIVGIHKIKALSGDIKSIIRVGNYYDPFFYFSSSIRPSDFNDTFCIKWYNLGVAKGNTTCMNNLGMYYHRIQNYKEAIRLFEQIYQIDSLDPPFMLYEYNQLGYGCKKNRKKAKGYLKVIESLALNNRNNNRVSVCKRLYYSYKDGMYGIKKSVKKMNSWKIILSKYERELQNTLGDGVILE
jgi:tetratricopeptide (TPR) repeat protein